VSEEPSHVETGIHPKLTNPLSEETRKERLYLLGMSAIGITIVFTGLIPTEIRTLGITFAEADRTSLLLIFALVVGYFLVAFVSYALSDYLEWISVRRDLSIDRLQSDLKEERASIHRLLNAEEAAAEYGDEMASAVYEVEKASRERLTSLDEAERDLAAASSVPFGFAGPIITLRFAFEFILPPIVGAFAIAVLLIRAL